MKNKKILIEHGSGGVLSSKLIETTILPHIKNDILFRLEDSAVFEISSQKFAFTTDSYVISPIFFPGGDIGKLAVNGTVNDLSMAGSIPLYLSLGIILEEGFSIDYLDKIMHSIADAANISNISIITGDTKVVQQGACDGIFINTSGIGIIPVNNKVALENICEGDMVISSGTIGDHGTSIMAIRAGFDVSSINIKSDTQPLNRLVKRCLDMHGDSIHYFKDPTRGGLGTILCEISSKINKKIEIIEENMPINREVNSLCEILGLDPLYLANEGKCVIIVDSADASAILETIKELPESKDAAIIGRILGEGRSVSLKTTFGGARIIQPLSGEPLPRIC